MKHILAITGLTLAATTTARHHIKRKYQENSQNGILEPAINNNEEIDYDPLIIYKDLVYLPGKAADDQIIITDYNPDIGDYHGDEPETEQNPRRFAFNSLQPDTKRLPVRAIKSKTNGGKINAMDSTEVKYYDEYEVYNS